MAAPALAVVPCGIGNDQSGFHRIPQADQTITQFGFAIESFDLVLQVAQFTDGA